MPAILISSGVTTINAEAFIDGLNVVFSGKMPEIMPDEANNILQDISTNSSKQKEKRQKLKAKSSWQKTRKKKA